MITRFDLAWPDFSHHDGFAIVLNCAGKDLSVTVDRAGRNAHVALAAWTPLETELLRHVVQHRLVRTPANADQS